MKSPPCSSCIKKIPRIFARTRNTLGLAAEEEEKFDRIEGKEKIVECNKHDVTALHQQKFVCNCARSLEFLIGKLRGHSVTRIYSTLFVFPQISLLQRQQWARCRISYRIFACPSQIYINIQFERNFKFTWNSNSKSVSSKRRTEHL